MGAWGTGPGENDTAADWFGGLDSTNVYKLIEEGLQSENNDEVRAAAYLFSLLRQPYVYNIDLRDKHQLMAVEALQSVLNDKAWLNSWNDPTEVKKSLQREIAAVKGEVQPQRTVTLGEKMAGL